MPLPALTLTDALVWAGAIAAVGIVYDTLEIWTARHRVLEAFFDWRVIRSRYYLLIGRPVLSCVFDLLFAGRAFPVLALAHGVAAVLFPFALLAEPGVAPVLAGFVLAVHCLSNVRLLIGRDGADQMQTVVWAGLCMATLPVAEWARTVAAGMIAAQLVLSYVISGAAKAASPVWRRGLAVALITRMATYCPRDLSRRLTRPAVSFCLCWMTIAFELGAPLLLAFGRPGALALIILGTMFHVGIGVAMGLTTFVFAFLATFPVVYYFAGFAH